VPAGLNKRGEIVKDCIGIECQIVYVPLREITHLKDIVDLPLHLNNYRIIDFLLVM